MASRAGIFPSFGPARPASSARKSCLGRWRLASFVIISVWAFVSVLLPLLALIVQSSSVGAYVEAFSRASDSIVTQPRFRDRRSNPADTTRLLLRASYSGSNAASCPKRRWLGAFPVYTAGNRHRHRPHWPMEQADDQCDLRHAGDHHPRLSRSISRAANADYIRNSGAHSRIAGRRRAAQWRQLVHDAEARRGCRWRLAASWRHGSSVTCSACAISGSA